VPEPSGSHRLGTEIRCYVKLWPANYLQTSKLIAFIESVLRRILPSGNPDFHDKFGDVRRWWLETDDRWEVHREIGFDERDQPIVAAPLGENLGVFTGDEGGVAFPVDGSVDPNDFERVWREFSESWKKRPR
jgi:hypothetical protein